MADPFGNRAEFGAAEFGDAEFGQVQAAAVTSITPGTGSISVTGQESHTRPFSVAAGSLTVTGQQASTLVQFFITPGTGSVTIDGQQPSVGSLSDLVSNEYVGDGASSRSFSSAGFAPLAVIVIGKDGSGNVVGAIKTPDMPAGKSMPFLENPAASNAGRSNRITSLDANGFTVGSDLNVLGRNYAFIMFPAGRASTVNVGTFIGPGGKDAPNSTLSVPSGTGTISGTACFTATGDEVSGWTRPAGSTVYTAGVTLITAGRRAIRNSDGAVLCEVTGAIDANNASGVGYIAGNIGGNLWHWEEYYADVPGFSGSPDMLLYFADDADTATAAIPTTVVAPTTFNSSTTASWQGTGAGTLLATFNASDPTDQRLHIQAALLTKSVRFHWIAFKANESTTGVKIALFQYTSDGTARSITGLDFAPEWAFTFGSASGSFDFNWTKKTTNIIGASTVRKWNDGSGDQANYGNTFNSDGFSVPAGPGQNLNNNTEKYTILLFVASPVLAAPVPATGSIVATGQQPVLIFGIIPSTGAVTATGQPATVTVQQNVEITPSAGSLTATGNAPVLELGLPQTTGHVDLTGFSPTVIIDFIITPNTGSLALTGNTPGVLTGVQITPDAGSLSLTGFSPILELGVFEDSGHIDVTGFSPTVVIDFLITPGAGSAALAGQPVTLVGGIPVGTATALNVVGQQPVLIFGIIPSTGSVSVTGQSAIVNTAGSITVNTGSADIVGYQPILDLGIIPSTGSVAITGYTPLFTPPVNITPGTGSVNIDGQHPVVKNIITAILLVEWNDRSKLNAVIPILWNVFSEALSASLPVIWRDLESINPLLVTWRVIPDLEPLFNEDVQQPFATVEEFD